MKCLSISKPYIEYIKRGRAVKLNVADISKDIPPNLAWNSPLKPNFHTRALAGVRKWKDDKDNILEFIGPLSAKKAKTVININFVFEKTFGTMSLKEMSYMNSKKISFNTINEIMDYYAETEVIDTSKYYNDGFSSEYSNWLDRYLND